MKKLSLILILLSLSLIVHSALAVGSPASGGLDIARGSGGSWVPSSPPAEFDFTIETGEDWDHLAEIAAENMSEHDVTGSKTIDVLVISGTKYIATHILWKDNNLPLRIYGEDEATIDIAEDYTAPNLGGILSNAWWEPDMENMIRYPGATIEVHDLTIKNTSAVLAGGALCIGMAELTISGSTFENTSADLGGALLVENSTLTISNSTFVNTSTAHDGGAVYAIDSAVTVLGSTFKNTNASYGGAVLASGTELTISGSTFENTSADVGGALSIGVYSTGTISDSAFKNASAHRGGAVFASHAEVTISGSDFIECSKTFEIFLGGRIYTSGYQDAIPNAYVVENGANLAQFHETYPDIVGDVWLAGEPFILSQKPFEFMIWLVIAVIAIAGAVALLLLKARMAR